MGGVGQTGLSNEVGALVKGDEQRIAISICGHGFHVRFEGRFDRKGEGFHGRASHRSLSKHGAHFCFGMQGHGDGLVEIWVMHRDGTNGERFVDLDIDGMDGAFNTHVGSEAEHGFGVGKVKFHGEVGRVPFVEAEVNLWCVEILCAGARFIGHVFSLRVVVVHAVVHLI